jgi:hypothetical protein
MDHKRNKTPDPKVIRRADVEMLWVDAWNDLYDIIAGREDYPCVLPDYSRVSPEECRGWLQQSVYDGVAVTVSKGWYKGRPAVVVAREQRTQG